MIRVWIAQCLCPQRHCIGAAANEGEHTYDAEELLGPLREALDGAIEAGALNPWCGLCGAPQTAWRYEVARTRFRTLVEATPALQEIERQQRIAAAAFGRTQHTRN